jgi:hypothetical protein
LSSQRQETVVDPVAGGRNLLRFLPDEQSKDDQAGRCKHRKSNQCIDFQPIPHNLSPLTAEQSNAGVRDQREAACKQHDEKNEHRNQWVTHSSPPNGGDQCNAIARALHNGTCRIFVGAG